jgi:hypothetical protein
MSHLDSNCKKLTYALTVLMKNLEMADPHAVINHENPSVDNIIGPEGCKVPDNITRLQSFIQKMNLNAFKANPSGEGDALDSLRGGNKKDKGRAKAMFFSFFMSCDVEPKKLTDQVAFEWCNYGNMLRVKELQAMDTETPIIIFNVCSMNQRQMIQEEVKACLSAIKDDMLEAGFINEDVNWSTVMTEIPDINLRCNIPNIPKAKSTNALNKLPKSLQGCRRAWHIEVDASKTEQLKELVAHGKKKGFFKEFLGPHAHPTEIVTWDSTPGDIKRTEKFYKEFINYNASMTCTDIPGFHDINAKVGIYEDGSMIQRVSGRFVLTSLLKLNDGSSAVAEVHQSGTDGVVALIHPNTPEAEHLALNLQKHAAGFLKNYLLSNGVEESFVLDFLREVLDPALVHDADSCKWNEETLTITTPEELEDDAAATKLVNQSWFKDIVMHFEEQQQNSSRKSKNYASAAALYDLDATRSVKTTHEANDGKSVADELEERLKDQEEEGEFSDDVSSIGDKEAQAEGPGKGVSGGDSEGLGEEPEEDDNLNGFQTGHTPKSGFVRREKDGNNDSADEYSDDEDSSVEDVTPSNTKATASAAVNNHEPSSAGQGG